MCKLIVMTFLVCTLAACTQPQAHVQYKGEQFYGREFDAVDAPQHQTYSTNSPKYKEGYTRPVQDAAVPAVGISDLAPPTSSNSAPVPAASANISNTIGAPASAPLPNKYATNTSAQPFSHPSEPLPAKAAPADNHGRFIWPVSGKVISHFGTRPDGKANDGINIAVAEGEPVWAAADGTVVYAGNELAGYGNMIILRHSDGWMTAYAHTRSISVKKGATVKQGALIGYVGMTGGVKSPQLHFALRNGKTPVDPEQYLPKQ